MKRVSISVCKVVLVAAFLVLVFMPLGCSSFSQPGETAAEGSRRHDRVARINQQEMMADIDKTAWFCWFLRSYATNLFH